MRYQCGTDAQVFGRDAALALQALAQVALHARQGGHQAARVLCGDRDRLIQAAFGDVLRGRHGQLRLAAKQAEHRAQDPAGRQRQAHQCQHHGTALLPHHAVAVLLGLAAAGLVQGQDALADGAHAGLKLAELVVEIRVGRCAVRMRFGSVHHVVGGCDIGLQCRRHRVQLAAQCRGQRQFAVGCQRLAEFASVFPNAVRAAATALSSFVEAASNAAVTSPRRASCIMSACMWLRSASEK